MRRARLAKLSPRSGVAAVETAIVLPIFLAVLWGIIEFGRAMMVAQLLTQAARYGARQAMLEGSTNTLVTEEVQQFLVNTVGGIRTADVGVKIEITAATGNRNPNHQLAAARTRDLCRVSCEIPFRKVGYVTGNFLQDATLRGHCSMRHE